MQVIWDPLKNFPMYNKFIPFTTNRRVMEKKKYATDGEVNKKSRVVTPYVHNLLSYNGELHINIVYKYVYFRRSPIQLVLRPCHPQPSASFSLSTTFLTFSSTPNSPPCPIPLLTTELPRDHLDNMEFVQRK